MQNLSNSSHQMSVYSLRGRARCLEPQRGHDSSVRFFVGSCNVADSNAIHLVEVDSEEAEVLCVNVYSHASELVALASCPSDASLLASSFSDVSGLSVSCRVALWRLAGDESSPRLESVALLPRSLRVHALSWEQSGELWTADERALAAWDVSRGENCQTPALELALGAAPDEAPRANVGGLALDPHIVSVVAVSVGAEVLGFDRRDAAKQPVWKLKGPAEQVDCDFNPNKPYFLCTGGVDGVVRFWDYRKPSEPIQQTFPAGANHSHHISSVEFNPHHDSLVLSSSTDGLVNLYCAQSVSSSPGSASDYLVSSYNGFNDSVYQAKWASSDAWTFGSVSWNGKAYFGGVPDKEKMAILIESNND